MCVYARVCVRVCVYVCGVCVYSVVVCLCVVCVCVGGVGVVACGCVCVVCECSGVSVSASMCVVWCLCLCVCVCVCVFPRHSLNLKCDIVDEDLLMLESPGPVFSSCWCVLVQNSSIFFYAVRVPPAISNAKLTLFSLVQNDVHIVVTLHRPVRIQNVSVWRNLAGSCINKCR